jgi:hypothetical protein
MYRTLDALNQSIDAVAEGKSKINEIVAEKRQGAKEA